MVGNASQYTTLGTAMSHQGIGPSLTEQLLCKISWISLMMLRIRLSLGYSMTAAIQETGERFIHLQVSKPNVRDWFTYGQLVIMMKKPGMVTFRIKLKGKNLIGVVVGIYYESWKTKSMRTKQSSSTLSQCTKLNEHVDFLIDWNKIKIFNQK